MVRTTDVCHHFDTIFTHSNEDTLVLEIDISNCELASERHVGALLFGYVVRLAGLRGCASTKQKVSWWGNR